MRAFSPRAAQRGATLIVGLIMLLLFTLMVGSSFMMSGTNLKAVGNTQSRDDALAAANSALELVLSSPFTDAPAAQSIDVDLNNDATYDYRVEIAKPQCISASVADAMPASSVSLPMMGSDTWNTVWDIKASVQDAVSGASLVVHSGVRVLLTDVERKAVCGSSST